MAAYRGRLADRAGFTLLELLVAIAICAVVISSVYGAYRATFHTVSGTDKQVLHAAAARVILERITDDLEALYTGEDGFFVGEKTELGGERADTLKFFSSANLVFNREQVPAAKTTIEYKYRESESGGFDLIRVDAPQLPGQDTSAEGDVEGEILGEGLLSFSLSYFREDGEQVDDWQSTGVSTAGNNTGESGVLELPVLVQVEIALLPDNENAPPSVFRTSIALPQVYSEQQQEGS